MSGNAPRSTTANPPSPEGGFAVVVVAAGSGTRLGHGIPKALVALDGDEIVISITTERHKYRAITRDPQVSLCIIHEEMPFPYATVYGTGRIDEDGGAEAMVAVSERMFGRALTDDERAGIDRRVVAEHRVALRVTVDRVIGQQALRERFSGS